jgi:hypothetical protein
MHRKSTLERPDNEFIALANTIEAQCSEHAEEWDIDTERLSTLRSLTATAGDAYEKNSDRATRNHLSVTRKKNAFRELRLFLSPYINYLLGNLSVPEEALATMSLRPRRRTARLPKPRPVDAPLVKVDHQRNEIKVYVTRPDLGHPTQSTSRESYAGFKLRWRFDTETADHIEISTRLHHILFFTREDEARRIHLSAAWINHRLEEGPWSDTLTEIIT